MKTLKKILRAIILLGILGGLVVGGIKLVKQKKQENKQAQEYGLKPRPVTVTKAQSGSITEKRPFLAVVEPAQTAEVTARVTAMVEKVLCDEGDRMEAGDTLVELDGEEIKHRKEGVAAQIEQAKADLAGNKETVKALQSSLNYFKAEAERQRRLANEDAAPESRAEKAEEKQAEIRGKLNAAKEKSNAIRHRISSLEKQKEELAARLKYYTIKSPFDGMVAERLVDPGDQASPGKPLIKLEDRSTFKLAFDVPQQDLSVVNTGQKVRFSAGGERRTVKISVMFPSLNKTRMKRAEVTLSDNEKQGLSPGAYVPVSVVVDRHQNVTLVPRSSLIESPDDEKQHVFAVQDGKLTSHPVNVLGFADDQAAVEGISAGVQVVRTTFLGWAQLSSGEKVEAVR